MTWASGRILHVRRTDSHADVWTGWPRPVCVTTRSTPRRFARPRARRSSADATITPASTGVITELATGYPGYNSLMSKSCGTVAEILKQNGYNTSWYGKNHNVPDWQTSQAGPFDLWPTGLGFEYFYGFIGGDTEPVESGALRRHQAHRAAA